MISVTLLSSYDYCKRKLFIERVLKIIEIPKIALIKGSIRHNTFDNTNKIEKDIIVSLDKSFSFEDIKSRYEKLYSKELKKAIIPYSLRLSDFGVTLPDMFNQIWPSFITEADSRSKNVSSFIEKNKIYGEELWDKLIPKIKSEFRINSSSLGLRGIIDKLEIYPSTQVPIEVKTGKAPNKGVWPSHKLQIAAYTLLLEKYLNQKIPSGYIDYVDIGDRREIIMNNFLKQEIIDTRDKVEKLLSDTDIPNFCANKNKCVSCSLKPQCYNSKFIDEQTSKL